MYDDAPAGLETVRPKLRITPLSCGKCGKDLVLAVMEETNEVAGACFDCKDARSCLDLQQERLIMAAAGKEGGT